MQAVYRYANRAKEKGYRAGFAGEVREQIEKIADLNLSEAMFEFFRLRCPWLKLTYLQWLRQYRFNPKQVALSQDGGELQMEVRGPWFKTIYWEVPLLAIISELSRRDPSTEAMVQRAADWAERITAKAEVMTAGGVNWIDFGTRRRFDYDTQDAVCARMQQYALNFRGTSNPFLAMRHGLNVFGTYAHELVMAMQALYGLQRSNELAMEHWVQEYRGDLGIALTDTLTTDVFLRSFDKYYAKLFDGVRQDSGCPFAIGEKYIAHYEKLDIDPRSKVIVFSDSLNTQKAIALAQCFKRRIKTTMGIGTHLTNDVGNLAPNHVTKLVELDCGNGPVPLLELSDDMGKITGNGGMIAEAMRTLNIQPEK